MPIASTRPTEPIDHLCGSAACSALGAGVVAADALAAPGYAVNALLLGPSMRWNYPGALGTGASVSYSFLQAVPYYYPAWAEERVGFQPFSAAQIDGALRALRNFSEVANIQFTEVAGIGAITFGTMYGGPEYQAYAYYPNPTQGYQEQGDVWLNNYWGDNQDQRAGAYGYLAMLHEIGHAVGLKHSFDSIWGPVLPKGEDNRRFTVMSYDANPLASVEPGTLMLYDIAALQHLYGANHATRAGDTVYGFTPLRATVEAVWDGGGSDTIDGSAFAGALTIDLQEGAYSSIGGTLNVAIAFGAVIENAIGGSGHDTISGNAVANRLQGGAGNDTLRGLAGDDIFVLGLGDDLVYGGAGTDGIVFAGVRANYRFDDGGRISNARSDLVAEGSVLAFEVENFDFSDGRYTRPVALASSITGRADRNLAASTLFSISDPDGDAVARYTLYDGTVGVGAFVIDGVVQPERQNIEIDPSRLGSIGFRTGLGTDQLWVRAYDGTSWGDWTSFYVTGTNNAPTVTAPPATARPGAVIAGASLFSAGDADGDTLLRYDFWDSTAGVGAFFVNAVAQPVDQHIYVDAAQLPQTEFRAGKGTDQLWVRAFDGHEWSPWAAFTVTGSNAAPVAAAAPRTAHAGTSLGAAALFNVTDGDGDAVLRYEFWDSTDGAGAFYVNGDPQRANQGISVDAADLGATEFRAAVGTDQLWVRAHDGYEWGAWSEFRITGTNAAPIASASNGAMHAGTTAAASTLFAASDADGDAIRAYEFWDSTDGAGAFYVNGDPQRANQGISVAAADLGATEFRAGVGTDQLWVRAYDGNEWSLWSEFRITGTNAAPIASASNGAMHAGTTAAASTLFAASDADGDAIRAYEFWDSTDGAGAFYVNGDPQRANQGISVDAADLGATEFRAGVGTDQLWVRAYDGNEWSLWSEFRITGTNVAPIVGASNGSVHAGTTAAASTLFAASDADGDAIRAYEFWDSTDGAGAFYVNGDPQRANQGISVAAADLGATEFRAGVGTDQLWVRAYDGNEWSPWSEFRITGTNAAPTAAAASASVHAGTDIPAASLFNAVDADGDALLRYDFWDSTPGGGAFFHDGLVQGVNQNIVVEAAELGQTTFRAGVGTDQLWVRAYDGNEWGAWAAFTVSGLNAAPVASATTRSDVPGTVLPVSSLVSASDADGDEILRYGFWDSTPGSGAFLVGEVEQGVHRDIQVEAAQLASTEFRVGGTSDLLWVRAYDGFAWSAWQAFNVTGDPLLG
jgi:hypothetical protein